MVEVNLMRYQKQKIKDTPLIYLSTDGMYCISFRYQRNPSTTHLEEEHSDSGSRTEYSRCICDIVISL